MYGKKIKYYRMKNGMTVEQLASKLSCTKAAVSQYENDKRDPNESTLEKIANVFNITSIDLLSRQDSEYIFNHAGFRKTTKASKNEINVLKADIESKCIDQVLIMKLLGIVPQHPFVASDLSLDSDIEENAKTIRKYLSVSESGPIYFVTKTLEKIGIIVLTFDCPESIEGLNGTVNGIPYIFFNSKKTIERQRFTLIHEFCHLFFNYLEDSKELEKYINRLTGHVLFPDNDLYLEFGKTNRNLNVYLRNSIAKDYKVAPSCLVTRLFDAGIVTETYYRNFFKFLNSNKGKTNEGSLLNELADSELPREFNKRVYRALDEELISKSRAAELLSIPLFEVMKNIGAI